MVGAMVVCRPAAPAGVLASSSISSGPNSQVLATTMRVISPPCGATARTISAPGPWNFIGKGLPVMARMAFDRVSTPVSFGGAEEWPPLARATILRVA